MLSGTTSSGASSKRRVGRTILIVFAAVLCAVALLALAWYAIYTPIRQKQRRQALNEQGETLLHSKAVDLQRYASAGPWREVARKPNPFERECTSATALYTIKEDGEGLAVQNTCVRSDGTQTSVTGHARSLNAENTALQVSFAPRWLGSGAAGDYWILHVDEEYRNALVGTPDRKYLWLLSSGTAAETNAATLEKFSEIARQKGFDTSDFLSGAKHVQQRSRKAKK